VITRNYHMFVSLHTRTAREEGLFIREDDYYENLQRFWAFEPSEQAFLLPPDAQFGSASSIDVKIPALNDSVTRLTSQRAAGLLTRYNADTSNKLESTKRKISEIVSSIFGYELDLERWSLFPSSTSAIFSFLYVLKKSGYQNIIFESPYYFASAYQAKILGFNCFHTIASETENFEFPADSIKEFCNKNGPSVFLITDPRYSLGWKRDLENTRALLANSDKNLVIIIDEAGSFRLGSDELSKFISSSQTPIIRIRGFLKGAGLNGIRITCAQYPLCLKDRLRETIDIFGTALDAFSIIYLERLSESAEQYKEFIKSSRNRVLSRNSILASLLSNSTIEVANVFGGYIGVCKVNLGPREAFDYKKKKMLGKAKHLRMPIQTGAAMFIPFDGVNEWFRVNYLQEENTIRRIAENLLTLERGLKAK